MKEIFVGLIVLFTFMPEGIAVEKLVTIANSAWQPYYGQELQNYGLAPQIISAAYARRGYKVQFETMPWARVLVAVQRGSFDAAATAYSTEERAFTYLFSDSYLDSTVVFFKRKEVSIKWKTLQDLAPYKIGMVLGNSYSPEFDKADFLKKDMASSEIQILRKLWAKRVQLVVIDRLVGKYLIDTQVPQYMNDIETLNPPLHVNKLYVMFSRNTPGIQEKVDAFNAGLHAISNDGTLNKILENYEFH
jgi:polar amino acid transport system substrate-binding protein